MTVDNRQFSATVSAWVLQTQARMNAVFRESTQRVVSQAQRRIPVDTGFARASVRASLEAMPPIDPTFRGDPGRTYAPTGEVSVVIAGAQIGQTIYVGWTANYAIFLEYGSSQQAPNGFVRVSAQEWPRIVSEVSQEAESRAGV
ncbi:MAG TPA: HK97 gp10 family phage protein [Polyangia bacterium]|nr:HK97 gp10 family phage protein [Polyangia bacterium]